MAFSGVDSSSLTFLGLCCSQAVHAVPGKMPNSLHSSCTCSWQLCGPLPIWGSKEEMWACMGCCLSSIVLWWSRWLQPPLVLAGGKPPPRKALVASSAMRVQCILCEASWEQPRSTMKALEELHGLRSHAWMLCSPHLTLQSLLFSCCHYPSLSS